MFTKRTRVSICLLAAVALNATVIIARKHREAKSQAEQCAKESKELSAGFRGAPMFVSPHEYYPLVSSLVQSPFWTERNKLPLAEAQKEAILKLDRLVWDATLSSWTANADYLDGCPSDYRPYVDRANHRRDEAVRHAQRAVALGLLTRTQAEFVTQRYLSTLRRSSTLGDRNIQEQLALTTGQKAALAKVWGISAARQGQLNLWSVEREEQRENRRKMEANNKATDEAAANILDERQRRIWAGMTAERTLPAEPPDLPALSDAQAATSELLNSSPMFRFVDSEAGSLAISPEQQRLLKDLKAVASQGMMWIGTHGSGHDDKRRAEFVAESEEVALNGILTQQQEDRVRAALTKK